MILAVNSADANYHESISHLGRTHLFMEPFFVETNKLSIFHPIRQILLPHMEGTNFINQLAITNLINKNGVIDITLAGDIASFLDLSVHSLQNSGFNEQWVWKDLESRGMRYANVDYPYRDDAIALWDATYAFMKEYVDIKYQDFYFFGFLMSTGDDAVQNDGDLQAWASTLASENGGKVVGLGEDNISGKILTRSYLADVLTMIAFTGGVQHAAINFAQETHMVFTPTAPGYGMKSITKSNINSFTLVEMLPSLAASKLLLDFLHILGSPHHTEYGQYNWLGLTLDTLSAQTTFKNKLKEIEAQIDNRNENMDSLYRYELLKPSTIPMSINI